jgi:hypothetical protein
MARGAARKAALEGFAAFAFFTVFFVLFFAPAEFGKLMASGDASFESLPALIGTRHLWEDAMLLGYPLYADPNQQQWYPLAWIASLPRVYNAFAVAPFPIAAFGIWGFVRSVTHSSVSGIVAGLIFALGGFMISHAGHLMISHPAAWAPYILWSIEAQRLKRNRQACVGGATAIGLCAVSGQPQVLAFILAVAAGYAIICFVAAGNDRRPFAIAIVLTFALGVGFGCVQLVPEATLAGDSTRATISLADFTALEIPVTQLATRVAFPYALGWTQVAGYAYSGVDIGKFTEDTIAIGLPAIVLALLAFSSIGKDRRVTYWYAIAVLALVLAIGDATPLPTITHRLPVYGLLRIPGRHAFEWTLAIALLAGYGTAALRAGRVTAQTLTAAIAIVIGIVAVGYLQFAGVLTSSADVVAQTFHVSKGLVTSPISNGALGIPITAGALGVMFLCVAARYRTAQFTALLLTIAVALDSGTFAYAAYWNWRAIDTSSLRRPLLVTRVAQRLAADDSRIAWLPGNTSGPFWPNLTTLWHVPTVDGYSPLVTRRAVELLGLTPSGGIAIPTSHASNLDVTGTSILATPRVGDAAVTAGSPFAAGSLQLFFSQKFRDAERRADLALPRPFAATSLTYVSELGDSIDVPQHADIASITLTFAGGRHERHEILAGRDTAEFAYDRPDVRSRVKHARATIYTSDGPNHSYVGTFSISERAPIAYVTIDWHYPTAALTLEKLSIIDGRTGTAHAFGSLASLYADPKHWQPLAIDPSILAFHNARALPHAWIAQPVHVDANAIGAVIRDGDLPIGGTFEAARQALVEEAVERTVAPRSGDRVVVDSRNETDVYESVRCSRTCFVVDRDAFDTDWKADVDGVPVRTFATDIDLRGVRIPPGAHRLHFHFFPESLALGSSVAMLSAIFALALLLSAPRRRTLPEI